MTMPCNVRLLSTLATALVCLTLAPVTAGAELIVGLTVQNTLISFDSAIPGTVATIGPITGLTVGETLAGIDRRPALGPSNGVLYGFGVNLTTGTARIYTLDEATAVATLRATLAADPADTMAPFPFMTVAGSSFGVDFNPVADRLRVTTDVAQNLRINVDNGLVQLDVPLSYESGDPNFGETPIVLAVAYSNNFGGASSTALRGVDISEDPDTLVLHTNPNAGTLQTQLDLPFDSTSLVSYDISGVTGTAFFSATPPAAASQLFAAGPSGVTLQGTIGGGMAIRGIAAFVGTPVPEPGAWLLGTTGAVILVAYVWCRRQRA